MAVESKPLFHPEVLRQQVRSFNLPEQSKEQPLIAEGVHDLRDEYTRTIEPARARAAETLTLERTLSDLVNQAYALTPAETALMWQTAPPRMPVPAPSARLGSS